MSGISPAVPSVLPRRLLRGVLLLWVCLIGAWVIAYARILLQGQTCGSGACLTKRAPATAQTIQGIEPLAFWALLILVLVCVGLSGSALSERVPMRWRWSYFLAQGILVFAIGTISGQGLAVATLSLALTVEALLVLGHPRLVASVGGGAFCLTLLWWVFASWGKLFRVPSLAALLIGQPTFLAILLFGCGFLVLYVAQVRAHEQLEAAHRQLRAAAERIAMLTLLTERQRMARELHDTLAQGLAGVMMQLQAANARLSHQRYPQAQEAVQQAMNDVRSSLAEARGAIADLRSAPETASDLLGTIQAAAERFTVATSLPCTVHLDSPECIPQACYDHLLRLVTEGLSNVARHAQAHQVEIRGEAMGTTYLVMVRDDGCGFDAATDVTPRGHFGLVGLHERARLVGGSLEVESAAKRGTVLRFRVPLPAAAGERVSASGSSVR